MKHVKILVNTYVTKEVVENDQTFILVPVVMMVEGVHHGSHGAIFHSAAELEKSVSAWHGVPVVVDHPQVNGEYISVNSPGGNTTLVGTVLNPSMDGAKLKAEIKLDVNLLQNISQETLKIIRQGEPLDVSIGVFSEETAEKGEWNGETYEAIAHSHIPDHLALLPDDVGACSYVDGCGIRINSKKGGKIMTEKVKNDLKRLNATGYSFQLMTNAKSLTQQIETLREVLNGMDTETTGNWLVEAYDDYFIYERYVKDEKSKHFKQMYSVNETLDITLVGEPLEVKRKVDYIQVNSSSSNLKTEERMSTEIKPCIVKAVTALIANKATAFDEQDREWLQGLSESALKKLIPAEPETPEPPQINSQQAIQVLRETLKSPTDFLNVLPDEMKDQFKTGLRLHQERRTQLITHIQANSQEGAWTEDDLKALDTVMLEKISKTTKPVEDYSAAGGSQINTNQDTTEQLLPPGVS